MVTRKKRAERDIEKDYSPTQFVAKLRRLADCIEQGKRFQIQVAGERISVPPDAVINIEHERGDGEKRSSFSSSGRSRIRGFDAAERRDQGARNRS